MKKIKKKQRGVKPFKVLIVCDDCVDSGILRYLTTIDRVAMRGRHAYVSLIAISQRITPISVNVRDNADFVILFTPSSVQEFESLVEKFIPRNHRKLIRSRLEEIFDVKYQMLVLDNTDHRINNKFRECNMDMWLANEWIEIDLRMYLQNNAVYQPEHLLPEKEESEEVVEKTKSQSKPPVKRGSKTTRQTIDSVKQKIAKRRKK
jgi:hypothetical protein